MSPAVIILCHAMVGLEPSLPAAVTAAHELWYPIEYPADQRKIFPADSFDISLLEIFQMSGGTTNIQTVYGQL